MSQLLTFPKGFLWGAATSSHQVEGNQHNDWSEWEKQGKIKNGQVSGQACDHWNRFEQDYDLAKQLHHNAHRFSIEWSRIEPDEGRWNEDAIHHYQQVVRALKQRGLEPFVTLWHFTNPLWLSRAGGWESAEAPRRFARFAERMARALPDVRFWMTINEANVHALLGYQAGWWPPQKQQPITAMRVVDSLADGHRLAFQAIKRVRAEAQVGYAHSLVWYEAKHTGHPLDRLAVQFSNRLYNQRFIWRAEPTDFIGINYYMRQLLHVKPKPPFIEATQGNGQRSDFAWELFPEGLYRVLMEVRKFRRPIYITENGISDARDTYRRQFISDHLRQLHRAIGDGVEVRGYFHWSLLDNFEWAEGYNQRFGLVEVDFATQARRPRPSARYYAQICKTNQLEV